jgi:S1-C subfamily serine protease
VTNNHVIEDADQIKVKLKTSASSTPGRRPRPETDLALLKIEGQGRRLPVLKLGDSAQI